MSYLTARKLRGRQRKRNEQTLFPSLFPYLPPKPNNNKKEEKKEKK